MEALKRKFKPWGHHIVLTALLLLFFISPSLQSHPKVKLVFDLLFGLSLGTLVMLNLRNPYMRGAMILLILASLGTSIDMLGSGSWHVILIHSSFSLLVMASVLVVMLRSLSYARNVSWDTISGALCAYLTMAAAWTDLFTITEILCPGSFSAPHPALSLSGYEHMLNKMFYFSIVTISSVGYGDIVPTSDLTRMMASFEAIMGQFFIAVMLARVVALHLRSHENPQGGANQGDFWGQPPKG